MDTFDKKQIFDRLCKDEKPTVDESFKSNQSIKLILSCGCSLVQHGFPGKPSVKTKEENPELYERILTNRAFWVELCNQHDNYKL